MPVQQVVIDVITNDKQLDSLLTKLEKSGQISRQQAAQFQRDSKTFEEAGKKRQKLLEEEIQDLTELKLRKQQAFSVKEIEQYNQRIRESEKRIETLGGSVKRQQKSFLDLDRITRNLGATIAAAFTVDRLIAFTKESINLAAKAEGIERAFQKLNRPNLLADLNKATRDTVTNVELMRSAIRANNFKIPLEQLASYFEFATKRSIETGESVDYLVNSIVDGIGRKSTLVLDNLGISATELQAEIRKTGDFGKAAGNIIARSLEETGDVADTTDIKIRKLNKSWEEFLTATGRGIIDAVVFDEQSTNIDKITLAQERLTKAVQDGTIVNEDQRKKILETVDASRQEFEAVTKQTGSLENASKLRKENAARILLEKDAIIELLNQYKGLQDIQSRQARFRSGDALTERIKEAATELRKNIDLTDLQAAKNNVQTESVKELLENYEKYLSAIDEGISKVEAFVAVNQKEFREYTRINEAIQQRLELEELVREAREKNLDIPAPTADEILNTVGDDEKERLQKQLDELLEFQQELDEKQAEQYDSAQESIRKKQQEFDEEDKKRLKDNLDFELDIAQARVDLARNVLGALATLARDNAEAQQGLLAFEKLAAIASIIINLQREIALNSALTIPGAREAANLQSRLRAAGGIATVLSTAIPAFAEGVIDLKGPGTSKSDSIMARLSKGESVMTAMETQKHKDALMAMRNKNWDDYIFKNYQLPIFKSYQNVTNDFNDRNIVDSQFKLRKELKGELRGIRADLKKFNEHQLSMR